jgi:hypothetical protein
VRQRRRAGVHRVDKKPGEVRGWSKGVEEECPEEKHFKVPVAFEPILDFMETKYEDARAAYMGMLPEHVGVGTQGLRATAGPSAE